MKKTYLGTFLIAFTALALEITLTRLLSVVTWYSLSFFAISTAMLGSTAGAALVYLKPDWFTEDRLNSHVERACLGFTLSVPFTLIVLSLIPLTFIKSPMIAFSLLLATAAAALPFFFSGIVLTVVLTQYRLPIGKLYASDLAGASLGSLFVLGGLELLDAPSLILLSSAVGALAGFVFTGRTALRWRQWLDALLAVVLAAAAVINSTTLYGIQPLIVKGRVEKPDEFYLERWNSFSRVAVHKLQVGNPQLWGPSPVTPKSTVLQYWMNIDGEAGSVIRKFASMQDIEHLKYDVTNVAYYVRPDGPVLIIGVGGGKDIQSALVFGHTKVVGVEINPIFIDLLKNRFRDFAGIGNHEGVTLVVDEGRSFVSRSRDRYSVIQMSLVDTWAATGAGAFSLSENGLYTVEAWTMFLNHLGEDGIFTVARWYSPTNLGETGRIVSLAVASLLEIGVKDPSQQIAVITSDSVSTLLVSKRPFTASDVERLKQACSALQFTAAVLPGVTPDNAVLKKIVAARTPSELHRAIKDEPLNYDPPTDETPYFFNMLRLNHLKVAFHQEQGVVYGNLVATCMLIGLIFSLLLLTIVTIVVPLLIKTRSDPQAARSIKTLWPGALYFSLIGAGFMFVEIALIERMSLFLSHPVYALGVLLFTIIASAGVGSLLSERLPLTRAPWIYGYPVITVIAILALRVVLSFLLSEMITDNTPVKIAASVGVLFPMGMFLGLFFPTGMRLARAAHDADTPWYWALNGIFGVLCSSLAVFISIYYGVSLNFYIAAACYLILLIGLYRLYQRSRPIPPNPLNSHC